MRVANQSLAAATTAASIAIATVTLIAPAAAQAQGSNGLARGQLYSTAATNRICSEAQQVVASTNLWSINARYGVWEDFVESDAEPFGHVGPTPLPWDPNRLLDNKGAPLTTTQHVVRGSYGTGNRTFPKVVSCKMKSADYLVKTGLDAGAMDKPCQAVHEYYVNAVVASLTRPERAAYASQPGVVFKSDAVRDSGPQWTAGFPDNPFPVLYREYEGGPINIKASRLLTAADPTGLRFGPPGSPTLLDICTQNPGFGGAVCQPRKWGVRYCHVAAPEYLREALIGAIAVPIIPGGPVP